MNNWTCIIQLLIIFAGSIIAGKIALDFLFRWLEMRSSEKKLSKGNQHLTADKSVSPEGLLAQFIRLRNETLCGQGKVTKEMTEQYDGEFKSILEEIKALKGFMDPKVPENTVQEDKES